MGIAGEWAGHFLGDHPFLTPRARETGDRRYFLKASFRVDGDRLTGTMEDLSNVSGMLYSKYLELISESLPPAYLAKERLFARAHPTYEVRSTGPRDSVLWGTVKGDQVSFQKTYLDVSIFDYVRDGMGFGNHPSLMNKVLYEGQLSASGFTIEGSWKVFPNSLLGPWLPAISEGTFRLYRVRF